MTNKQIIVLLILVIYMAVNMIVGLKASKLPAKIKKQEVSCKTILSADVLWAVLYSQ